MKRICRELQERLAEEGAQALRDDVAARRHLEECPDCFRVLEGLSRLDAVLGAVTPIDAPEPVVSELLERVRGEGMAPAIEPVRRPRISRPVLWGLASAAAAVLAVGGLVPSLLRARVSVRPEPALDSFLSDRSDTGHDCARGGARGETQRRKASSSTARMERSTRRCSRAPGSPYSRESRDEGEPAARRTARSAWKRSTSCEALGRGGSGIRPRRHPGAAEVEGGKADADDKRQTEVVVDGVEGSVAGGVVGGLADAESGQEQAGRFAGTLKAPRLIRRVKADHPDDARARVSGSGDRGGRIGASVRSRRRGSCARSLLDAAALEAVRQWVYAPTIVNGKAVPVFLNVPVTFRLPEPAKKPGSSTTSRPSLPRRSSRNARA
jgi:hypothetical protein